MINAIEKLKQQITFSLLIKAELLMVNALHAIKTLSKSNSGFTRTFIFVSMM